MKENDLNGTRWATDIVLHTGTILQHASYHDVERIRIQRTQGEEDVSAPFELSEEVCGLLTQLNVFDTGKFLLHVLGALKPANSRP